MNQDNEKKVRTVFLNLLEEKPVGRISVTEICTRAKINRTTFYKNYVDVFDLMEKTEEYVLESFREKLVFDENRNLVDSLIETLSMAQKYIGKYAPLLGENGDPAFIDRLAGSYFPLFEATLSRQIPELSAHEAKLCYTYISSGCSGIIAYWLRYDRDRMPEEIAREIEKYVRGTIACAKS